MVKLKPVAPVWLLHAFLGHCLMQLQQNHIALVHAQKLSILFPTSPFVCTMTAMAYYHMRGIYHFYNIDRTENSALITL